MRKAELWLSWLLLPIYIIQGLSVRRKSIRLTPPTPQHLDEVPGTGKPIRLLMVGDSSAAGVGVDTIKDSLAGHLQDWLSQKSKRPIHIRIAGCNSATSGQIRDFVVPNIKREKFTHVILCIGTNDAKNFHTGRRFCRDFGTLLYALRTRFPTASILWPGILDLSQVPTLPWPLNEILGIRSREMMRRGQILCQERLAEVPEGQWSTQRDNFAIDGFHASAQGYRQWAKVLAEHILANDNSKVE